MADTAMDKQAIRTMDLQVDGQRWRLQVIPTTEQFCEGRVSRWMTATEPALGPRPATPKKVSGFLNHRWSGRRRSDPDQALADAFTTLVAWKGEDS